MKVLGTMASAGHLGWMFVLGIALREGLVWQATRKGGSRVWLSPLLLLALQGGIGYAPREGLGSVLQSQMFQLEAPDEVRAGKPVLLKLKVKNSTDRALELPLGGRPPYDFIVTKADGSTVWRWLDGQAVQDILELKILQPGEVMEFDATWTQVDEHGRLVPPGVYLVRGVLHADPPRVLQTDLKRLKIVP